MNHGFIKLQRSPATWELLKDKNAFTLLTVIALRARRTEEFNYHNLRCGEAFLGDHEEYGLTRSQYRTAVKRLRQWGLAAFQPTTRGTVAKLLGPGIYDINESGRDPPATNGSPPSDPRRTTNKNEKKEKKGKEYPADSAESCLSQLLWNLILERKPDFRRPHLQRWAVEIDRLLHGDGRTVERVEAVIRWCQKDPFWQNNILSPGPLRKHFDRLELEMARPGAAKAPSGGGQPHPPQESLAERLARLQREDQRECTTAR